MAQIGLNAINSGGGNSDNNIGFFSLKNDGDEAIVRFMYDDASEFELLTVHEAEVNGKKRKINCIRDPQEDFSACPLCAKGDAVKQKFFIRLIQYVFDQNTGAVIAQPKVWERTARYAFDLKSYLDTYGPLSDCIFKIKRQGAAGSKNTRYVILPCNTATYDPNVYAKDTQAFENYKALGTIVIDRNFNDLLTFSTTGNFPAPQQNTVPLTQQPSVIPNTISTGTPQYAPQQQAVTQQGMPQQVMPQQQVVSQVTTQPNAPVPTQQYGNVGAVQRPVRAYNSQ